MAKNEASSDSTTAVMERPETHAEEHDDAAESPGLLAAAASALTHGKDAKADKKSKNKAKKNDKKKEKDADDEPEYEVEFQTPFGKLEFEFEPVTSKEKRDKKRTAQAERDTAKKAAEASKKAEQLVTKQAASGGGGGGKLLLVLLVIGAVMALVALAIWLFARPGIDDDEAVPPEFRNDGAGAVDDMAMVDAPHGFAGKARARIRSAVRAGRHASREAQQEQEQRFENMTHPSG